jgi:hypothetical protein
MAAPSAQVQQMRSKMRRGHARGALWSCRAYKETLDMHNRASKESRGPAGATGRHCLLSKLSGQCAASCAELCFQAGSKTALQLASEGHSAEHKPQRRCSVVYECMSEAMGEGACFGACWLVHFHHLVLIKLGVAIAILRLALECPRICRVMLTVT